MIAFRVTDKLFFFGKKSQTGGLWYEIGPQSLAPDFIAEGHRLVSLRELDLGDILSIAFWTKKDALAHCDWYIVINQQETFFFPRRPHYP